MRELLKMKNKTIMMILAFALLAAMFSGCSKEEEQTAEEVIRAVKVMEVFSMGGEKTRTFTGVSKSGTESKLSFKIPGTIKTINAEIGSSVTRNQLIATLDKGDYQLQVAQAQAALEQAQAQQRNANATFARIRALYENNNASRNDFDAARAASESTNAAVTATSKQLELARLQLSYCDLYAPVTGRVAAKVAEENENIGAGMPVIVVMSGAKPEVVTGVPEAFISQVKAGDKVRINFPALNNGSFNGMVTEVSVATSQISSTYPVIIELENNDPQIRSGMTAEVEFVFDNLSTEEKIIVKASAVNEDKDGRFVYIVEPTEDGLGTVRRRKVVSGDLSPQGIEVLEGLTEHELVVIAGVSRMKDGLTVRLLDIKKTNEK